MKALVTGGAGFVGSNYAQHLLDMGFEVVVFDNLARGKGCEINLNWLRGTPNSKNLKVYRDDLGSTSALEAASKGCDLIVHATAQVSVPKSVSEPRLDFESNAIGTFNLLETARKLEPSPTLLYTSSNKVYGMPEAALTEKDLRY